MTRLSLKPTFDADSRRSQWIRKRLTGAGALDRDDLRDRLPARFSDAALEPAHRTELLSIPFRLGQDHLLKVVTTRTLRIHNLMVRSRNLRGRLHSFGTIYRGFLTPADAVQYRYDALDATFQEGGVVPKPVTVDATRLNAYLITTYHPTTKRVEDMITPSSAFIRVFETVRQLHRLGFVHGSTYDHIFLKERSAEPLVTDIIGRTTPAQRHRAQAYDIAGVLCKFAPLLGSWAVTETAIERLPEPVLDMLVDAVFITTAADSETRHWVAAGLKRRL